MVTNKNDGSPCRYNKDQKKVIEADKGCHLVLAGAGTGKTFTMVERVTYLLETKQFLPSQLLILTFSRKAADELRQRIEKRCGLERGTVMATTFHAFSLYLLRRFCNDSMPGLTVIDDDKSKDILAALAGKMRDRFLGIPVPVILGIHSQYRQGKTKLFSGYAGETGEHVKKLDLEYREYKKEHGLVDFNDMINHSIELLTREPALREQLQAEYQYILVDEFQDTSTNNFQLLSLLVPEQSPLLMVVGDDWQSIYGFRNAKVEYIINMKRHFNAVQVFKLTRNYRSRKEILNLAGNIIRRNRVRTRKRVFATTGKGGIVRGYAVKNIKEEARRVVELLEKNHPADHDTAILFRNNWQGELIQKEVANHYDETGNSPQFMTIHASKGLEFHTVILAGIRDGIFPDPSTDIEEERRLLYVACTRAKERLFVIYHLTSEDEPPLFARESGFKN